MRHILILTITALAIAGCSSTPRAGVVSYDANTGKVLFGATDGSLVELDYTAAVQAKPEARVTLRDREGGLAVTGAVSQNAAMRAEDIESLRQWSSWKTTDDGRFGFGVVTVPNAGGPGTVTHYLLGMPVPTQDQVAGAYVFDVVSIPYRRVSQDAN